MNNAPRQTLRELIARHGPGLCSDARRCEGLLRDLCWAHRLEINILISALKERVPLDILAAQGAMPRELLLARLAKRLEDQLALTASAARWAVDSWALALGVITDAELADDEKRRAAADTARRDAADTARRDANATPAPAPARPAAQDDAEKQSHAKRPPVAPPPPLPPTSLPQRQPRVRPPAQATRPAPTFPVPAPPAPITTMEPSEPRFPFWEIRPRKRGGQLRGCMMGCLLLVLLSLALFVGVPFVVSVLYEEQQQRSLEPPPVLSR